MRRGIFSADIIGLTTLTFGRMFQSPRKGKESAEAQDKRCWRERCHINKDDLVLVPPIAFKLGMEQASKLRNDKVPGKNRSTFTARFKSGIMTDPTAPETLVYAINDESKKLEPVHIDDVIGRTISVPSDGTRGGSKRVPRCFPEIDPPWNIAIGFMVVDADIIEHPEMISETLETAGYQVGIGCNRPGTNGGDHGIFRVENFKFEIIE